MPEAPDNEKPETEELEEKGSSRFMPDAYRSEDYSGP